MLEPSALVRLGYQPQTAHVYTKALTRFAALVRDGDTATFPATAVNLGAMRLVVRLPENIIDENIVAAARRWLATHTSVGGNEGAIKRRKTQLRRQKEARSFTEGTFTAIYDEAWANQSDPEHGVLAVLCTTGLRVGDVLNVTRAALEDAAVTQQLRLQVKGGDLRILPLTTEWENILDIMRARQVPKSWTVASLVTGRPGASTVAGDAAYARIRRTLETIAENLGIAEGRVHLHRLRRTVAVRALSATSDTTAVQQLLGHRSAATTALYLDETRPQALAALQATIHPSKRKTP